MGGCPLRYHSNPQSASRRINGHPQSRNEETLCPYRISTVSPAAWLRLGFQTLLCGSTPNRPLVWCKMKRLRSVHEGAFPGLGSVRCKVDLSSCYKGHRLYTRSGGRIRQWADVRFATTRTPNPPAGGLTATRNQGTKKLSALIGFQLFLPLHGFGSGFKLSCVDQHPIVRSFGVK